MTTCQRDIEVGIPHSGGVDEFRHPKPSATPQQRYMGNVWAYGWVLGTVVDILDEKRRARRQARQLAQLPQLDLERLRQDLAPALAGLKPPEDASADFYEGWALHGRLMEWLAREDPEGLAIRHAVDAGDGRRLLDFMHEDILRIRSVETLQGFQEANRALAAAMDRTRTG